MGGETTAPVTIPSSSSTFSSIRYLGLLKQPDSDLDFELDESDVVWSSDLPTGESPTTVDLVVPPFLASSSSSSSSSSPPTDLGTSSYSPSDHHHFRRADRPFLPEKLGLSAALADDDPPLVRQRRPSIDSSRSAATAARIVPVSAPRSGSDQVSGRLFHQSAPVNVPSWPRRRGRRAGLLDDVEGWEEVEEEKEEEEEMLPPHVIVARSHVTTFSVFEGVGRTLKGRDLRRVRNAVFRQTGFLD